MPATSTTPSVSLVICTRNRAQFLKEHFQALASIKSNHVWEIIFVNNQSTDDTFTLLTQFANGASVPVSVLCESELGLGNARNTGWKFAKSPIVAFTDDDCYPQSDFIDAIAQAFEDEGVGYVGGRVMLHDPTDLPITIKESLVPLTFAPNGYIGPGMIHGANFAVRRNVLLQLDGFDALMGSGTPYPCEDCDLFLRASYLGVGGRYSPDLVVRHHHRRKTQEDLLKIERAYLAGRGAFFIKAILHSPQPIRIFYEWLRSGKYFGFKAWLSEWKIGFHYLIDSKKIKM